MNRVEGLEELVKAPGAPGPAPGAGPSRRKLIGGALAALWGAAKATARDATDAPPLNDRLSLQNRLIGRITWGMNDEQYALASALGYNGYLEYQLAYESIDDSALNAMLAPYTTLNMTFQQLYALPGGQVRNELIDATLLRAIFSKRQLFERAVEMWTDHFNIDINNGLDQHLKTIDDRDVIRLHALGKFPELLSASAHSPAMLYYLDNHISTKFKPNENYARELLELHTMGADGGYTQTDVEQVAKCFTGWTFLGVSHPTSPGTFFFNNNNHDQTQKTVLGNVIPANGGMNDGLIVLNILANHPVTAKFIARKLCTQFWGYNPPTWLVDDVAAKYTATGGDIREMIRVILSPHTLAQSDLKYKRPMHHFVSALRATGATVTTLNTLRTQLQAAGHLCFYWPTPDGYPDDLESWVGLVIARWNFGASLLNGNLSGLSVNVNNFLGTAATAAAIANRISGGLFGGQLPAGQKSVIQNYLLPDPPTAQRKQEAIGLATGSPAFQWY